MVWWINGISNDEQLIAALQAEIDSLSEDTTDLRLLELAIERIQELADARDADLPPPPDFVIELTDVRTNKRVRRAVRVSFTQLATSEAGRTKSYEYAIADEAKRAFRDLQNSAEPLSPLG